MINGVDFLNDVFRLVFFCYNLCIIYIYVVFDLEESNLDFSVSLTEIEGAEGLLLNF